MRYLFAENKSYEHLAAGSVIKSYTGHTNFPVRLGQEIFQRCLSYSSKKEDLILYDPLCGSGYLLTALGLLNFDTIQKIYGSDIKEDVLNIARDNLRLLTQAGIDKRRKALQDSLDKFKRDSYQLSLSHIGWYQRTVKKDMSVDVFAKDLFAHTDTPMAANIIIMDLPYDNVVNWGGNYSASDLENQISKLVDHQTIIAVIRNKKQKLFLHQTLQRLEKFQVGKRMIEIFKQNV